VSMGLTNYWPHGVLLPLAVGIAVLSLAAAFPRSTIDEERQPEKPAHER